MKPPTTDESSSRGEVEKGGEGREGEVEVEKTGRREGVKRSEKKDYRNRKEGRTEKKDYAVETVSLKEPKTLTS